MLQKDVNSVAEPNRGVFKGITLRRKITRWFLPALFAVFLIFSLVTPVLAIDEPNDLDINGVWAYRNCRESGDQLYLISYSINYTTNPTESVAEAFLCRLMSGSTELRAVAPCAYYDDGYGDGVVAIYFDTNEAPIWEGAYTMKLLGNPLLSWNASVPETSVSTFDLWQDNQIMVTRIVVAGRIIDLALDLETSWGKDMVGISDAGDQVLTDYGAAYFVNVVPYLFEIAPNVYAKDQGGASGIIPPEIPPEVDRTDHADELVALIIDTPLDMTAVADAFHVSRGAMTAIMYYGVVIMALVLVVRRIGSYKPIMMFSIPLVILGAFVGVPLIVTILAGLASLGMVAYMIFYKPSNA